MDKSLEFDWPQQFFEGLWAVAALAVAPLSTWTAGIRVETSARAALNPKP